MGYSHSPGMNEWMSMNEKSREVWTWTLKDPGSQSCSVIFKLKALENHCKFHLSIRNTVPYHAMQQYRTRKYVVIRYLGMQKTVFCSIRVLGRTYEKATFCIPIASKRRRLFQAWSRFSCASSSVSRTCLVNSSSPRPSSSHPSRSFRSRSIALPCFPFSQRYPNLKITLSTIELVVFPAGLILLNNLPSPYALNVPIASSNS